MDGLLSFLIYAAVLAALGVRALIRELDRARARADARRRLHAGAPQLADHELVTVSGTVRVRDALLEAPLSGRLVVFHRSVVHVKGLETLLVACEMVPFELETAEGIVRIEGETAEVAFAPLPVIPRQIERVRSFLEARGVAIEYAASTSVDEIAVEPGVRIAVHGVVRSEIDLSSARERGYREEAPSRMTLRAQPDHPLMLGPSE